MDATSLMPAAKEPICYFLPYLSEMANTLKYLDKVLQYDGESSSPEMLSDVCDLCRSCEVLLDSISSATRVKTRSRSPAHVTSIFRRGQSRELRSGLGACTTTFQLMAQTIVVAKMGAEQSQASDDKGSIILLTKELGFLEAIGIQQQTGVQQLQEDEDRADVVEQHFGVRQIDSRSLSVERELSTDNPRSSSPGEAHASLADTEASPSPEINSYDRHVRFTDNTTKATGHKAPPKASTSCRSSQILSEILLRIVPHVSRSSTRTPEGIKEGHLLESTESGFNVDASASSIALLLLGKWIVSGSDPIWDRCVAEDAKSDGEA